MSTVELIFTALVLRTPMIYPAYEKTETQAATSPIGVFPSFTSTPPNESTDAPDRDINTATIPHTDFFSRKTNIITNATANGYIK